ncbi:hypothetical protein CHU98_g4704 [Xylaria longipes]|nr:hypothetical protein CHU98_g4704 [Xylaria longipes]
MSPREHYGFHNIVLAQRPQPRLLAVDWYMDLIYLPWYPGLDVKRAAPFDKITRLAINLDQIGIFIRPPQMDKTTWTKKLLQTFPALEHLTIVFDGEFYAAHSEMRDYDYISCLKDIAKNEYYFSPSPKKTIDEWVLRVCSKGSMDRGALEGCGWQHWRYHSDNSTTDDTDAIRGIIAALKPGVEVEDVVDTTVVYLWD